MSHPEKDIERVIAAIAATYWSEDERREAAVAVLDTLAEAGRLQPQPARIVQTWYRSKLPDGSVWCESSQPDEVRDEASIAKGCSFWKLEIVQSQGSWQPWEPVGHQLETNHG